MAALPRLKRRREFLLVAAQGRKWVTPGLILQANRRSRGAADPAGSRDDASRPRVGFTVSGKVGNSVVRNRVRRRLRAAAEIVMPTMARDDCDYVVIGRRESLTRGFAALVQDLEQAMRKVRIEREAAPRPSAAPAAGADGSPVERRM